MAERDPQIGAGGNYPAYEADYAAWLDAQIDALREGRFEALDIEHLTDEVADLGISSYRSFVSALRIVLIHMLKWDIQEDHRTRSWADSIEEHRHRVQDELDASPSYRACIDAALAQAFRQARAEAATETKLPLRGFPQTCPFTFAEIMTREHLLGDMSSDGLDTEH